jgi:hypothetical protein
MDDMTMEQEWLSQILGSGTKPHYTRGLHYLMEFLGVSTGEELLKLAKGEKHFETRVIQFYTWLQEKKGLSGNSARSNIIPIQSFFTYAGCPLRLKHKLPKLHGKIENWKPTFQDLQKLYGLGDISVKAWMSLSRDVPARMGDMLKITSEQVESGEFLVRSQKEGVTGKCFISEQTRTLFRQLDAAKITLPRSQRGIDKMMANASRIAGLAQRLNQHLWRKIFITTALNQGISEVIWKVLTFKTVPLETLTYYLQQGTELKEHWEKITAGMPLEVRSNGNGKVTSLEEDGKLFAEALWELVRPVVEKKRLEKLMQGGQKGAMGLLEMEAMPTDPKEGLKLFLKLRKGGENERGK